MALVTNRLMSYLLRFLKAVTFVVDVTVVNPLIDMYAKMQHEDLAEAVKQKNNRYAERRNAAGLNLMACAFETTGAMGYGSAAAYARHTAELSDITFKVAKERIYQLPYKNGTLVRSQ